MREMALEKGVSLEQLGEIAKTDQSIDKTLDNRQIRLGKEEDNFIIDGRLSFHFIPDSIKVFLDVQIEEGAKRILRDSLDGLRKEEKTANLQEAIVKIQKRIEVEKERYLNYYNINPYDRSQYDLVIDTTNISAEETAARIIKFIESRVR